VIDFDISGRPRDVDIRPEITQSPILLVLVRTGSFSTDHIFFDWTKTVSTPFLLPNGSSMDFDNGIGDVEMAFDPSGEDFAVYVDYPRTVRTEFGMFTENSRTIHKQYTDSTNFSTTSSGNVMLYLIWIRGTDLAIILGSKRGVLVIDCKDTNPDAYVHFTRMFNDSDSEGTDPHSINAVPRTKFFSVYMESDPDRDLFIHIPEIACEDPLAVSCDNFYTDISLTCKDNSSILQHYK
jgi:hypothetical protein